MVDLVLVKQAMETASAGLVLIDKISDEVMSLLTGRTEPSEYRQFAQTIEVEGDELVAMSHGDRVQFVTAEELAERLSQDDINHLRTLETAMQHHYSIWAEVYPQLALMVSPVDKAKVKAQLAGIVLEMKDSLLGILQFVERCGFYLDDHYLNIRDVVERAG